MKASSRSTLSSTENGFISDTKYAGVETQPDPGIQKNIKISFEEAKDAYKTYNE